MNPQNNPPSKIDSMSTGEQSPASDIAGLIKDLSRGGLGLRRKEAAEAIGKLPFSHTQIVTALIIARDMDENDDVRKAAADALLAPVHKSVWEQNSSSIMQATAPLRAKIAKTRQQEAQISQQQQQSEAFNNLRIGLFCLFVGMAALVVALSKGTSELVIANVIRLSDPVCLWSIAIPLLILSLFFIYGFIKRKT